MRSTLVILLALSLVPVSRAGVQQDFFMASVQQATHVRIVKMGLDTTTDGAMCQHVLLDSTEKKRIEAVAALIDMVDPQPEKREKDDKVWAGSVLSFGVAEYVIEFSHENRSIIKYGMSSSMKFLTPYGPHGAQKIDFLLDYPLTLKSSKKLKRFIGDLKELPVQRTTDN